MAEAQVSPPMRPDILPFWRLLEGRLFRIPEYQRAYSWEKEQRKDLFEDIEKTYSSGNDHFMATIVCLKQSVRNLGTTEFHELNIVDGQQRVTSLIILLKAISKHVENSTDQDEKDEAHDLNEMLVKRRGDRPILLQTNHDNSNYFANYLKDGTIPNLAYCDKLADMNLYNAIKESEAFVEHWIDEDKPMKDLLLVVKNKLWFILHTLDNEGTVYTVFEVLNSRGLPVDWLDKCKSMLMGVAFDTLSEQDGRKEKISEMHKLWQQIYAEIGLNKEIGDKIIPAAATLLDDKQTAEPLSASQALMFFRDYSLSNKTLETSQWILKVTKELVELDSKRNLKAITKIAQVRLLYIAIRLRDDLSNEEKMELLKEWEKVSFRIFGLKDLDSRSMGGPYTILAQCIYHKYKITKNNKQISFPKSQIMDELKNLVEKFPIDEVIKAMESKDLYDETNWKEDLLYFLFKYEQFLAKEKGIALDEIEWKEIWNADLSKTIEHIYPQSDTNWKTKIDKKHLHTLGNLTLLTPSANSTAKDNIFHEKKEIYNRMSSLLINKEIASIDDWNEQALKDREKRLLAWAAKEWA